MSVRIDRRSLLKYGIALSTGLAVSRPGWSQTRNSVPPSIVFILADDLGYGDLGCYDSPDLSTPAIDGLAREGVRFTQFYANAPDCTPTRAALLTGRYPQRVGGLECSIGLGNVGEYDEAIQLRTRNDLGLPPEEIALPRLLKDAGYTTALIGKWHLGYEPRFHPRNHGFDSFFGVLGDSVDYFFHTEPDGKYPLERNGESVDRNGYLTDILTEEAIQFLRQQSKEKPFFLFVSYTAPHAPYQAPDDSHEKILNQEAWNRGSRQTYIKMVERVDRGIGQILETLKKQGLDSNTFLAFSSDHGGDRFADNSLLAHGKGTTFEGGIRVPCLLRWPGRISQGVVTNRVAITLDLTASMARIAGVKPGRPFDGIDIVSDIERDRADLPRTLYWRYRKGDQTRVAIRNENMKYLAETSGETTTEYLFDLANDPEESGNLIESRDGTASNLRSILRAWERDVTPQR